ncbi:MAG: sugar transferase [Flavobacteriales bacterium]|nr:sugar transferase [Flavobacteriales bacterium]
MKRSLLRTVYILVDYVAAIASWWWFYVYRKTELEPRKFGYDIKVEYDDNFFLGLMLIPICWVIAYYLFGTYNDIFKRHRIKDLGQTLLSTLIGVLILFFVLLLDDQISDYRDYYHSFGMLFASHFILTFVPRFIITSRVVKNIHQGVIGFNTLIIGSGQKALDIYKEVTEMKKSPGFKFMGYLNINGNNGLLDKCGLQHLGTFEDINDVIQDHEIEEAIIAIESQEHKTLGKILNEIEGQNVSVKISPDIYDIMSGSVKMTSIFGTPLIQINSEIMPAWQRSLKRILDLAVSFLVLILLFPVYLAIAIGVMITSKGPIFFKQERIGWHNKPFFIHKFRTMFTDAEKEGPQLSSTTDSRITKFGRWLRKTRLDELPQFYNVIKGDMSLVGPRPERQFFIDKIMERAPHYRHLQKVRPGITSWGQVKYGYAENVDQMIQRLKFDLLYIENMSLAVDFKILGYTVLTILRGSGK